MNHAFTTTAFDVPGCRTVNTLGVVRYDANEIMAGVTEVLCYGTAVVVEAAT